MRVNADFDTRDLLKVLGGNQKKIAYAVANATNATAYRIQEDAQGRLDSTFTLRSPQRKAFLRREAAIIKPFANAKQGRITAEIFVGQEKERLLLAEFERGAVRRPFTPGAKHVAVPVTGSPVRPTKGSVITKELEFRRLALRPQIRKDVKRAISKAGRGLDKAGRRASNKAGRAFIGQVVPWRGKQHTFMLPGVGVFQRVGLGRREDLRLIYAFDTNVMLPSTLGFVKAARAAAPFWYREYLERSVILELNNESSLSLVRSR